MNVERFYQKKENECQISKGKISVLDLEQRFLKW